MYISIEVPVQSAKSVRSVRSDPGHRLCFQDQGHLSNYVIYKKNKKRSRKYGNCIQLPFFRDFLFQNSAYHYTIKKFVDKQKNSQRHISQHSTICDCS